MSNQTITMTAEQTAIYDADGGEAIELMTAMNRQAQALADETGDVVEVVTADGIVANTREPQA